MVYFQFPTKLGHRVLMSFLLTPTNLSVPHPGERPPYFCSGPIKTRGQNRLRSRRKPFWIPKVKWYGTVVTGSYPVTGPVRLDGHRTERQTVTCVLRPKFRLRSERILLRCLVDCVSCRGVSCRGSGKSLPGRTKVFSVT